MWNWYAEERLVRLVVENVVNDVLSNEAVMYNMVDIKTYNDYTYFHSMNTGVMAGILGVKMELPEDDLNDLVTAAFLHDVGKVLVLPDLVNATRQTDTGRGRRNEEARLGGLRVSAQKENILLATRSMRQSISTMSGTMAAAIPTT